MRVKRWSATSAAAVSRLRSASNADCGVLAAPDAEAAAIPAANAAPVPPLPWAQRGGLGRGREREAGDRAGMAAEAEAEADAVAAADCVGVKVVESRSMAPSLLPPLPLVLPPRLVDAPAAPAAAAPPAAAAVAEPSLAPPVLGGAARGGRRCQRSACTWGKASRGSMLSSVVWLWREGE